jgi:hypothetical protein
VRCLRGIGLWQRQASALHFVNLTPVISPTYSATFPDVFRTPESPHLYLSDTQFDLVCGVI